MPLGVTPDSVKRVPNLRKQLMLFYEGSRLDSPHPLLSSGSYSKVPRVPQLPPLTQSDFKKGPQNQGLGRLGSPVHLIQISRLCI